MARQAGLDIADTQGMGYNPLTRNYFLGDKVDVNYLLACRPAA